MRLKLFLILYALLFSYGLAKGSGLVGRRPDHWDSTSRYNDSAIAYYTRTTTTDANSRITLTTTETGGSSGTALFSTILSTQSICYDSSGSVTQAPWGFVESQSVSQTVMRFIRGTSTGVLVGGTVVSTQFAGSGYTCKTEIKGLR